MKKPRTLQQAIRYFSDEQVCIDTVARLRWKNGRVCPACGHGEHYYLATQKRWKCKGCQKQFSVKLGTIFEDSPISLDKWLAALWMIVNCKNGVSSYEISRAIGVTQKSAWFMMHRIRLAMQGESLKKVGGKGKEVAVDEAFIGGKSQNMHQHVRELRQVTKGDKGKVPVLGILERGGRVCAKVISSRKKKPLQAEVRKHVATDSTLFTDALPSYEGLIRDYKHQVIDHAHAYVDGAVHTNNLENFWSLLKRGLRGTYVSVDSFHLFRYLDEQAFRYNTRKGLNDGQRFDIALSQTAGKRLTYSEVTGKVGQACN